MSDSASRIRQQLDFIIEIDRLKGILRRTTLCDGSRAENSAEHSWHLALMASVLVEHAPASVDAARVIRMLLVHDIVEIDAGDTFAYDAAAGVGREDRERVAAERIYGMLPPDQETEFRALWDEFEAGVSPEARFAVALDRLQPLLNNDKSKGGSWRLHGVSRTQVLARMRPIEKSIPELWPHVMDIVDRNCGLGHIKDE